MQRLPKLASLTAGATIAALLMLIAGPGSGLLLPSAAQAGSQKGAGAGKMGSAIPECNNSAPETCHVDITIAQGPATSGAFCDSFDRDDGLCVGSSRGTPAFSQPGYSPRYGIQSSFTWESHGAPREVDYTSNATFTILDSFIRGDVPASNSAIFNVTDAWNRASGVHWKTVATGGGPGSPGGPLYIDYDHTSYGFGSEIHIFGYLVRK
jgi:hypothetical protein